MRIKIQWKRDLFFGLLFLLIFISTCVSIQEWQEQDTEPEEAENTSLQH